MYKIERGKKLCLVCVSFQNNCVKRGNNFSYKAKDRPQDKICFVLEGAEDQL